MDSSKKRVEYDTNGVTVSIDVEKDVANHRVVLRVQNNDKAEKVLSDAGFKLIDDTMFAQF